MKPDPEDWVQGYLKSGKFGAKASLYDVAGVFCTVIIPDELQSGSRES